MAVREDYTIKNGYQMCERLKEFANSVKVGDWFYIPIEHLAIGKDFSLADGFVFEVKELYKHFALLSHKCKLGENIQAITYTTLFMFADRM